MRTGTRKKNLNKKIKKEKPGARKIRELSRDPRLHFNHLNYYRK